MFSFSSENRRKDGILNNFLYSAKLLPKNIWLFQYFFVSLHR